MKNFLEVWVLNIEYIDIDGKTRFGHRGVYFTEEKMKKDIENVRYGVCNRALPISKIIRFYTYKSHIIE